MKHVRKLGTFFHPSHSLPMERSNVCVNHKSIWWIWKFDEKYSLVVCRVHCLDCGKWERASARQSTSRLFQLNERRQAIEDGLQSDARVISIMYHLAGRVSIRSRICSVWLQWKKSPFRSVQFDHNGMEESEVMCTINTRNGLQSGWTR